jgi:prepilin peptidase CpaA
MIKDALILTLFPACMAFAAAYDLLTMTVPNRIAIALLVGFACLAPFTGLGLEDLGIQLAVAMIALAVGIGFFAMGWIGGGDAKLLAATVLWLPPAALLNYGLAVGLLGGMLTMLLLAYRRLPLPAALMQQSWMARLHDAGAGVPYGIALAAGGLIVYPHTPFMAALGN